MTTFGDGLYQFGGVPVDTPDYAGWFGTNTYFVDGDNGSDDNDGKMGTPFVTIQAGIDAAGPQDTVYIRGLAPDADASEPGTYEEDLTIPYANHGMKLIGVSSNYGVWGGPKIKNATAVAMLTVNASNVLIKNLQFNCTRNSGTYGIYLSGVSGYATEAGSVGAVIQNCMIKNASATYGGIYVDGGYGTVVRDCVFYNAVRGVWLASGGEGGLPSNQHRIINCDFTTNNGASIANHVYIWGFVRDFVVRDCTFGLSTNPINCTSDGSTGIIFNCGFNNGDTTMTAASAGDIIIVADNDEIGVSACWAGDGTPIATSGS